jgi:hypothetical protein
MRMRISGVAPCGAHHVHVHAKIVQQARDFAHVVAIAETEQRTAEQVGTRTTRSDGRR